MIALLTGFLRWTVRNLVSLLVIVLVLYFGQLLLHEWRKSTAEVTTARNSLPGLEGSVDQLQQFADQRADIVEQRLAGTRQAPAAVIESRLGVIDSELISLQGARRTDTDKLFSLVTGQQSEIIEDYQRELQISLLDLERANLNLINHERTLATLRNQHIAIYATLMASFTPGSRRTCPIDPESWHARLSATLSGAAARQLELCKENSRAFNAFRNQKDLYEKLTRPFSATEVTREIIRPVREKLESAKSIADRKSIGIVLHEIASYLPAALGILLLALITPALIKTFMYYVVAPFASRRPPIQLLPKQADGPSDGADPLAHARHAQTISSVSHAISISPDQELLVHADYLQSSGTGGRKNTKWLLNARYPLASLAAGMSVLTRIQPQATEMVVVSSTTDPFSEVGVLELGEGGAMVLQPHNLVGVLQPRNRPIRISSHWRLGSLTAWLTLQLRFLVFHGPGSLVVKGCRGIRVEPAGSGRMINQAATMGFTASLPYSTTRTETFVAYLLGKQELFNDRFAEGPGFYVYEEMPYFGKKSGITGRGFEGLLDSVMKIVGI